MKLSSLSPAKSLHPAYRVRNVERGKLDRFKNELARLLEHLAHSSGESEEHLKNIVADFLKGAFYRDEHFVNTKDRQDLVIHNGRTAKDSVGVIIEAKKPGNKAEMLSPERPNSKALHELLRYYLNERSRADNREIRHLVITDIHQWYIFDAADFERHIYANNKLLKQYADWSEGRLGASNTDWFYKEIAAPFFEKELPELRCCCFDIRNYAEAAVNADPGDDDKLLDLYKILSPEHLLKKPFANDSNSLNKQFYDELLYILGLEEVKEGGKKIIDRAGKRRHDGSLVENTLSELEVSGAWRDVQHLEQFGDTPEQQQFSIALELCITWLNRILFLKLLEGQLLRWRGGTDRLLSPEKVKDFDEMNELFFHVLAVPEAERRESVAKKFGSVPYLNSSLFEQTELERRTLRISALKDRLDMPLAPNTVLLDGSGKRHSGALNTLHYLFAFLDAYDFSSNAQARVQADNRDVINASVLGLIFEKINGYRDGSFFTPGFITMYMCRETLRRAVLQKFNERYGWDCRDLDTELHNEIQRQRIPLAAANEIINSLRICDPAVGSGHFLVSALNELIAVKSDLGILCDRHGKLLPLRAVVGNDELILTDPDTDAPVEYKPGVAASQRIQEALFHEKQTLIENCLFGVDINPKSVMICRLRLWVELLKHAYFKQGAPGSTRLTETLETLPNIDINIKTGNSLVSRFALDEDLKGALKSIKYSINDYRNFVRDYKNSTDKEVKRGLLMIIDEIKNNFRIHVSRESKEYKALAKLNLLYLAKYGKGLFDLQLTVEQKEDKKKMESEIEKASEKIEDTRSNKLFINSFEWRFEFPEVLDEEGRYVGFDVVLGNPPYGDLFSDSEKQYIKNNYTSYQYKYDAYIYFIEVGLRLTKKMGLLCLITPELWLTLENSERIRDYISKETAIILINVWGDNVFEDAVVSTATLLLQKGGDLEYFEVINNNVFWKVKSDVWRQSVSLKINYRISPKVGNLIEKIEKASQPLQVFGEVIQGLTAYDSYRGHSKDLIKNRGFHSKEKADDTCGKWLDGKDLERYSLKWRGEWLSYGPWLAAPRESRFFENKRILFREIPGGNKRIQAHLVSDLYYYGHSISPFIPLQSNYDCCEYILGCVNSSITSFYARTILPNFGKNIFPKLNPSDIKQLPIPQFTKLDFDNITDLVTRILAAKQADSQADTSALEAEVDQLVYGLYGLTEEEIKIVEGGGQ